MGIDRNLLAQWVGIYKKNKTVAVRGDRPFLFTWFQLRKIWMQKFTMSKRRISSTCLHFRYARTFTNELSLLQRSQSLRNQFLFWLAPWVSESSSHLYEVDLWWELQKPVFCSNIASRMVDPCGTYYGDTHATMTVMPPAGIIDFHSRDQRVPSGMNGTVP